MKKTIIIEIIVILLYLLIAFLNKGSNYVLTGTIPFVFLYMAINLK